MSNTQKGRNTFALLNDPRIKIEMAQFSRVMICNRPAIVDTGLYERYQAYNWVMASKDVHYIDK